ncbi:MAG: outer-membrane lipoprotein carrier protein LolA [Gammaproteobacteria bacterium]
MLANSPAIVLGDPQHIGRAYKVEAQGVKHGINWFYLTPRAPDSGFDHVRLGFAGNNLFAMELFDSFGQKTELHSWRIACDRKSWTTLSVRPTCWHPTNRCTRPFPRVNYIP